MASRYPPLNGSLFVPEMLAFNATYSPALPQFIFYDQHADNLHHISRLEFYRACQRIAHAVRPGRQGVDGAVVGIIANLDTILYHALTLGLIYAGLIPFPMSPRNSAAAIANMMCKTDCRRLIVTRHSLGLLDGIRDELGSIDIQIDDAPTLAYAYPKLAQEVANDSFVPYPKANERPLKDSIMLYLHSSGSTGFPKPIPITYLTAIHWCNLPSVMEIIDFPHDIRMCAASLPAFVTIGLHTQLFCPIASLASVAVHAPTSYQDSTTAPVINTMHTTMLALQQTKSNALAVIPAFLEDWAISPHAIEALIGLEYVVFGGGPLSKKAGDILVSAGVRLTTAYGGTEFGPTTAFFRSPDERTLWEWIRFGPNQRIRWVDQGDGTYECQVLTCPTHQVSIENLPDVKGYATSDVFIKHPAIEGLYKIVGRLDDVLVHSSGEKTVPAPMETAISSSPYVSGVIMFGRGRNQTGVLVEPRTGHAIDVGDEKQLADFRNKIWSEVEEANKNAPAYSRIFKEMILVTSREKPMLRAAKGTVVKKTTLALYASEVDILYESMGTSTRAGINVPLPASWSQLEVQDWLLIHATAVNAGKPIRVDADVFEQGLDSLSSTFLKNRILGSLKASPDNAIQKAASFISPNVIFANPTLRQLASHLIQCVTGKDASPCPAPDTKTEIENMIAKYSAGLKDDAIDRSLEPTCGWPHDRHVVLLTGSTGGLGSYLLASLLSRDDVVTVYAFNRPSRLSTIQERQRAAFVDRGLDTALLDSEKLVHIQGDAAQKQLSLDERTYTKIRSSITMVIHNAWRLDFNLVLSSFEPLVQGTRNLIDLARASGPGASDLKSKPKARFLFTSSISSAQGWDKTKGAFPETVQMDADVAVGSGYGASKYVCERILAISGLAAISFRIGQITGGAPKGAWSTTDWVPIIVKSSMALDALPDALGVTSWIPPDAVSDAILDVAFADTNPPQVVNLVHPRPVAWASMMQSIGQTLCEKHGLTRTPLPLIPFTEWVSRVAALAGAADETTIRRVPAIKLLNFIRALSTSDEAARHRAVNTSSPDQFLGETQNEAGYAVFSTTVAQRVSATMRTLVPLTGQDATRWVDYWVSVGLFETGEAPAPV